MQVNIKIISKIGLFLKKLLRGMGEHKDIRRPEPLTYRGHTVFGKHKLLYKNCAIY